MTKDLTEYNFTVVATFMQVAAKVALTAVNSLRDQCRHAAKDEPFDIERSAETVYIMEIMIQHLHTPTKASAILHEDWINARAREGVEYGPAYVPNKTHPKMIHYHELSTPAKIEIDMVRGIVSHIINPIVAPDVIQAYVADLIHGTDPFMRRTMN